MEGHERSSSQEGIHPALLKIVKLSVLLEHGTALRTFVTSTYARQFFLFCVFTYWLFSFSHLRFICFSAIKIQHPLFSGLHYGFSVFIIK